MAETKEEVKHEKKNDCDWAGKDSLIKVRKGQYDLFFESPKKVVAVTNQTTNKTTFFENAQVFIDCEDETRLLLNTCFDVRLRVIDVNVTTTVFE